MAHADSEFSKGLIALQDAANEALSETVRAQGEELSRLRRERFSLAEAIRSLPTFDASGPGEDIDRWLAAIEEMKQRLEDAEKEAENVW
jgi:translation initiation factor 2B subunit (eIF-2B alpha/beta/delta family)